MLLILHKYSNIYQFYLYNTMEKSEILPFTTTQMRFQGITVSEISQAKSIYDIICGILKNKHTHTHTHSKNSAIQRTDWLLPKAQQGLQREQGAKWVRCSKGTNFQL